MTSPTKRLMRNDIPGCEKFQKTKAGQASTLYVGPNISMAGEIHQCQHLIVEGTIEAELHGSTKLEVLESGMFRGTITVTDALIDGRFEGELTVTGRLTIGRTGVIAGKVYYNSMHVEPGATIEGSVSKMPEDPAQESEPEQNNEQGHIPAVPADHKPVHYSEMMEPFIEDEGEGSPTAYHKKAV